MCNRLWVRRTTQRPPQDFWGHLDSYSHLSRASSILFSVTAADEPLGSSGKGREPHQESQTRCHTPYLRATGGIRLIQGATYYELQNPRPLLSALPGLGRVSYS